MFVEATFTTSAITGGVAGTRRQLRSWRCLTWTHIAYLLAVSVSFASGQALASNAARPNIVVFLSDDHTWRDSSVYGSADIQTPNMKRLESAGMTFDNAYVASPSCAPSRAALLTGLYPQRNGAEPNHSRPREEIKKLPAYLQELGYQVVSFGKVGHYQQTPSYGFDAARHFGYHEDIAVPNAIEWLRKRESEKPLCLFVGTNWPHVPWPTDIGSIDPLQLDIPPNHVDSAATRKWRANYVAAIQQMDTELGLVYDTVLEQLGEETLFVHTSDHGAQWPFAKWTLYDDGIRTPLIVSWPGRVESGARSRAMVSWIDLLPTLVDAADGPKPDGLDGRSFLPVLEGKTQGHRDLVFTSHSGDGDHNVYPSRSVSTQDGWKYILNLHPEFEYTTHITNAATRSGYWHSWLEEAAIHPMAARRVQRYQMRPRAELYHVTEDPYELKNLIDDAKYQSVADDLRIALEKWIDEIGDQMKVYGTPRLLPNPNGSPPRKPILSHRELD